MRIVIDGTVGAGKTTVLKGYSQRDSLNRRFQCIKDMGYPVFGDLIINVIAEMRREGYSDPMENWHLFFERATRKGIEYYNMAKSDTFCFYDRGIYYLEIMSERYHQKMPDEYYDFCSSKKYDDPVFIFELIPGLSMLHPHEEDNRQKVYTLTERSEQQKKVIKIYQQYGYSNIINVPTYSDDITRSVDCRIRMIKEMLRL